MLEIGKTRLGREIGKRPHQTFIWSACVDCGKKKWRRTHKGNPLSLRCRNCAQKGDRSPCWKGGRTTAGRGGYIWIKLQPDDFFYPMARYDGYVAEHRLVVAKALNRCLLSWEVVHHKGTKYPKGSLENRRDNRYPENLELLPSDKSHIVDRVSRSLIARLEKQVLQQAQRITQLEKQIQYQSGNWNKHKEG